MLMVFQNCGVYTCVLQIHLIDYSAKKNEELIFMQAFFKAPPVPNKECPSDITDQIGGWATEGVGHGYGRGVFCTSF